MASPHEPATKTTAEAYDSIGQKYEIAFPNIPLQKRALTWLLEELPIAPSPGPSPRILDIGSGTGKPVSSTLAASGCSVLGIDISAEMLRIAQAVVPSATFVQADVRYWQPPQGQQYDAVTAFFSLTFGFRKAEIRETIAKAYGWLKPGGVCIYATIAMDAEDSVVEWMGQRIRGYCLTREDNLETVRAAGFEVLEEDMEVIHVEGVAAGVVENSEQEWEEEPFIIYARRK